MVTGKPRVLDSLSDKLAAAALDDEYKQEGVGVATAAQDYIVVGPSSSDSVQGTHQLWLDGFAVSDATIRQFVAMPAGTGHSVEHQITGNDCVGGLQFEISPRLLAQDTIQIFIKVLTGRVIPLYFSTTNGKAVAIHDIKNAVSQKENIPVDNCDLIYGGKKLSNGVYTTSFHAAHRRSLCKGFTPFIMKMYAKLSGFQLRGKCLAFSLKYVNC